MWVTTGYGAATSRTFHTVTFFLSHTQISSATWSINLKSWDTSCGGRGNGCQLTNQGRLHVAEHLWVGSG